MTMNQRWRHGRDSYRPAGETINTLAYVQWLRTELQLRTRTVRHPGNHKYAWALERRLRHVLVPQGYPKTIDVAA